MKILHLSKYYHPFRGGIEKVIKDLSEGMVERGHEVRVLSSSEKFALRVDDVNGVEVFRLPRLGVVYSQPLTLSLFWQLQKHLEWADVVHVHTPNPLAELAFVINNPKVASVATYHCDVVRQRRLMKVYGPVQKKVLASVNDIVVSTPNHLKYSEPLQDHLQKCHVVPFGVNPQYAKKTIALNSRVKEIRDQHGDYFLFIGRLVPYKGIDFLLKAMTEVSQKLICIGIGPRWEIWNQMAKDLGVAHKVEFLGKVESDLDFAAYIHGCQSLVLPSVDESEAFGIVLIEAMACGKPVITTQLRSGVSWVNAHGESGLSIPAKDSGSLVQALQEMAGNHELRRKLGEGALARFQDKFTLGGMVSGYEDVYMESADRARIAGAA